MGQVHSLAVTRDFIRIPRVTPFQIVSENDLLKATLFNRCRLAENGCWQWVNYTDGKGYGMLGNSGKNRRAHRVSYEAYHGPIPDKLVIRHTCDNPGCINPDHLLVGTMKDNMMDRDSRGRRCVVGEQIGTSKITEKEALEIKSSSLPSVELSKQYGVTKKTVWEIRSGRSWKHLNSAVGQGE